VKTAAGRRLFWRWVAGVLALFGLVALLGSCGVVSNLLDTQQGLRDAGYQSVHVGFHDNGGADNIDASVTVAAEPTQEDALNVASVVWAKLHERLDNLSVTVHGNGTSVSHQFTFDELQQAFGPRNPSYNSTTVAGGVRQLGFEVLAALAAIGAIVAVVAILITRKRRRTRGTRMAGWPAVAPGPGAPAAGWPGAQPQAPGAPPVGWPGAPGTEGPPPAGWSGAPPAAPPGSPLWPPPAHPPRRPDPPAPPADASPPES